jgi:hypothetical protein
VAQSELSILNSPGKLCRIGQKDSFRGDVIEAGDLLFGERQPPQGEGAGGGNREAFVGRSGGIHLFPPGDPGAGAFLLEEVAQGGNDAVRALLVHELHAAIGRRLQVVGGAVVHQNEAAAAEFGTTD